MDKRIHGARRVVAVCSVLAVLLLGAAVAITMQRQIHTQKLPESNPEVSLLAVGDIMLSREVGDAIAQNEADNPFAQIADVIGAADIAFGNLENPIVEGEPNTPGQMIFHAQPGVEQGIAHAGFDVLSLANNHAATFGEHGLERTIELLRGVGVESVGAGSAHDAHLPVVVVRQGIRFAFLAYVQEDLIQSDEVAHDRHIGVAVMDIRQMEEDIAEAKNVADVVVVSMHAGDEYADDVTDTQVDFAHKAIRAGAALVIGSHPHVVQPVENYHGGVILYSLGNFVFDQLQSDATRQSVIAVAHFRGAEVQKVEFTPVVIGDDFAPRVVSSVDGSTVLKRLGEEVHTTGVIAWDASAKTYVMTETTLNVEYNTRAEDSAVDDGTYQYALSDGQLTVTRSGMPFWTSPEEWYVDSYALADAVGDGTQQLTMSVWKAGDFGPSKPFWVTENDPSVKNHFFVFKFTDDTLEPVWQSSNLEHPNCAYVFRDLDTDGKDELVVTEGTYTDGRICNPTHAAVWEWSEWGFYNEWRSTAAVYTNLRPNGATVVVDVQHD